MAEPAFNPLSSLAAFGDAFAMLLCSVFPSLPDGLHTFVILLADVFVRVHLDRAWERVVEMFAGRAAVATAKDHLSQAAPNYGGRERKVQDTTSRLIASERLRPKRNGTRRVVIVTGGYGGIGAEVSKACVKADMTVIVAGRSQDKANAFVQELRSASLDTTHVHFIPLDLTSLDSVNAFVQQFQAKKWPLHILINNAGIMDVPYTPSKDGIESQFAVNHLAHFYLTLLLLDKLQESGPSRIINTSSCLHIPAADVDYSFLLKNNEKYTPRRAYSSSKLCNILFTYKLARVLQKTKTSVNVVHPGVVNTDLFRLEGKSMSKYIFSLMFKTPMDGALSTLYAALSPRIESQRWSGKYIIDAAECASNAATYDVRKQDRLWKESMAMLSMNSQIQTKSLEPYASA